MSEPLPRLSYEQFRNQAPEAYAALLALGQAANAAGLDKAISELVKLRASQINGCAFCLRMHVDIARRLGIAEDKLDLVSAWREAGVFTEREQAALAWTEALTTLSGEAERDAAYARVLSHFSPEHALFLTVTIGTINQWNRLAIAFRFSPDSARAAVGPKVVR
jgi:AhpD family alkylhydroperoxidase